MFGSWLDGIRGPGGRLLWLLERVRNRNRNCVVDGFDVVSGGGVDEGLVGGASHSYVSAGRGMYLVARTGGEEEVVVVRAKRLYRRRT